MEANQAAGNNLEQSHASSQNGKSAALLPHIDPIIFDPLTIILLLTELTNANELTELVQNMLTQMQNRFKGMSENIVMHIDEMGNRIEDLEKSIGELVNEAASIDD